MILVLEFWESRSRLCAGIAGSRRSVASRTEDSFSTFIFFSVRAVFYSLVTLGIRFVESENVG